MKKLISIILALIFIFSAFSLSFAGTEASLGSETTIPISANVEAATFSVTVPTTLPVTVMSDGTVVTATDAKIINNTSAPIEVTNAEVSIGASGWTLVPNTTDLISEKVDTKKFSLTLMGKDLSSETVSAGDFGVIAGNASLPITYSSKVVIQSEASDAFEIGSVVFTIGWVASETPIIIPAGLYNGSTFTSWESLLSAGTISVTNEVFSTKWVGFDGDVPNESSNALVGLLVFPNDGSVTSISNNAFNYLTNLKGIVFQNGIQQIGVYDSGSHFEYADNLSTIYIPSSVTELKSHTVTNAGHVFYFEGTEEEFREFSGASFILDIVGYEVHFNSKLMSFTMSKNNAEVTYYGVEGMTWEEWANSGFNTGSFSIKNNYIYNGSAYVYNESDEYVLKTDIVEKNINYILEK